jgi:thiamine-monophosphate kinase
MNRNLSDCAAMACLPAAAVATVALPRDRGIDYAKQLFAGMKAAADAFDFPVVGGDTGSWDGKLVMTVTILGRSAGIKPVTRSGAKPGNSIWVTGPLGGSILGRHMTFEPRVAMGRALGACPDVTAMIDLSDGLSRDLRQICRMSSVGAVILEEQLPIHPDVSRLPADGLSPVEHALHDGEDHELLVTIDCVVEELPPELDKLPLHFVGTIEEGSEIVLRTTSSLDKPLLPRGWEHRL